MKTYFQRATTVGLVLFVLVVLLLLTSCSDDDGAKPTPELSFKQIGLDNLKVYELVSLDNDSLFAATSDGVYVKNIKSFDPFALVGLKGRNVLDVAVFNANHIIATTGNRGAATDNPGIHETLNGGTSWDTFEFGEDNNAETAYSLSLHPNEQGTVFATGSAVVAKSLDFGRSWQPVWGDWGAFASGTAVAAVNPYVQTDLWYGGQGGIENGYLGFMRNEQPVKQWEDLVDNPTVAVELAFTNQGQNIFVGFEGALMKTTNNGDDWHKVIDGHVNGLRFFYGIDNSETHESHVYAGGWLKGVEQQPLVLFISHDSGNTWVSKVFEQEQSGGIFTLKALNINGDEKIYVGLDGGGVYEID